jgi:acetyltransferase-like isoleucine patch superfamily enzyme
MREMVDGKSKDFREVSEGVFVHKQATLDVVNFTAGKGTIINAFARLFGTSIQLGRETWIDENATIGGGSAFDPMASLIAGDWLHLGNYSQINIARGVTAGHEVGIGIGTRIFTHGAYLSEWEGFPVSFGPVSLGDRVWLPNAQVNPEVSIGSDVVVGAGSLVNSNLPDGCLAAGMPAKILKERNYPKSISSEQRLQILDRLIRSIKESTMLEVLGSDEASSLKYKETVFSLDGRWIAGPADSDTESIRNQLRRHGIRFRFEAVGGEYQSWN